jgi:hypothetical protein
MSSGPNGSAESRPALIKRNLKTKKLEQAVKNLRLLVSSKKPGASSEQPEARNQLPEANAKDSPI